MVSSTSFPCPLAPQTGRNEYLHAHSYSSCSWERLQVSFVFNKEYTWQHPESLLPPGGRGQSSFNRMHRDIRYCVGSSSCTLWPARTVATVQLLSLLRTISGGPGQGWQWEEVLHGLRWGACWTRPWAQQHLGTLVAVESLVYLKRSLPFPPPINEAALSCLRWSKGPFQVRLVPFTAHRSS